MTYERAQEKIKDVCSIWRTCSTPCDDCYKFNRLLGMIEEQYVSIETAKLLKEKRFNEDCIFMYDLDGGFKVASIVSGATLNNQCLYKEQFSAPTQQMAMRWLREVHDIKIMIRPYVDGTYSYEILNGFWYVNFDSHEDAAEAAIKYCLENLI